MSIKETACGEGAQFVIDLDGDEIYHSNNLRPFDPPIHISLDINGGNLLNLSTLAGDGMECDWTIWGDPYLVE